MTDCSVAKEPGIYGSRSRTLAAEVLMHDDTAPASALYSRLRPPAALADALHSISVQQSPAGPVSEMTRVLPGAGLELLVHYGDPFLHFDGRSWVEMPRIYAVGQRTRTLRVRASGSTGILLVRFRIAAASLLLGGELAALTDRTTTLDTLLPPPACSRLEQQVRAARNLAERLVWLQRFLVTYLRRVRPDPVAIAAVDLMNACWGRLPVGHLAEEMGISRRQLARRFVASVGVAPKRFACLVRFQKAIGLWRLGIRWPEIVERCGFVDQAHFIGEFKRHSGLAPGAVRCGDATPLQRSFNLPEMSQISNTNYL